ncbi:hypothetical protein [Pseudomonas sp. PICF141]|uniref:hypothetical protein n=1 Tax=Pseudomonas sp. PICF141 TaxID=1949067 RepID=UPI000BABE0EF|nr:hypothetical protein [Pseudomonas sp. PICF141]PAU55237.1 hypothetical protein BZL43_19470 [Pseudomonas sp. PICF141]
MLLAKSCFSKDHVNKRKTIRLGTLDYYKKTVHEQIVDKEEGEISFHVKFDERVTVSTPAFNTLFWGMMHLGEDHGENPPYEGYITTHVKHLQLHTYTKSTATILSADATIKQTHHNNFIFCMSRVEKAEDAKGIFPEYDDYWYLNEENAEEFGGKVSVALHKHITDAHAAGNNILPNGINPSDVEVYFQCNEVYYLPREVHINNSNASQLEELVKQMAHKAFTKPIPYEPEKEFRFVYTLVHNKTIISPTTDSAILDISELMPLLFW